MKTLVIRRNKDVKATNKEGDNTLKQLICTGFEFCPVRSKKVCPLSPKCLRTIDVKDNKVVRLKGLLYNKATDCCPLFVLNK